MTRIAALIVLCLAVLPTLARAEDDPQAVIAQLRQRVAELEKENADLRQKLGLAEQEKQELVQKTEDLSAEREHLEKLAGVTAKGDQVESAIALVDATYNADKDATHVTFKPKRLSTNGTGPFSVEHYLSVTYDFAGQKMQSPPDTVNLLVYTFLHPTNIYKNITEADVVIDGSESVTIPLTSYEVVKTRKPAPSVKRGEERYDELLRFAIDADTLRKLSNANEAVIKLPGNDLVLDRSHIALLAGARQRISQGL